MRREKHYIAVDRKKAMRCKWCGTTESDDWMGSYCSKTYSVADSLGDELCGAVLFPTLWIIAVNMWPIYDSQHLLYSDIVYTATVFGVLRDFCIVPTHHNQTKTVSRQKGKAAVPKGSRDFDEVFDERYLYCEKCGAPLEVIDGAIPVRCSYCGFMNRVSYGRERE